MIPYMEAPFVVPRWIRAHPTSVGQEPLPPPEA